MGDFLLWRSQEQLGETVTDAAGAFAARVPYEKSREDRIGVIADAEGYSRSAYAVCLDLAEPTGDIALAFRLERAVGSRGVVRRRPDGPVPHARVCLWPTHCGPTMAPDPLPASAWWKEAEGDLYVAPNLGGLFQRVRDPVNELGLVHVVTADEEGAFVVSGLSERWNYHESVWTETQGEYTSSRTVYAGMSADMTLPPRSAEGGEGTR